MDPEIYLNLSFDINKTILMSDKASNKSED
jgi:hypothetical protein